MYQPHSGLPCHSLASESGCSRSYYFSALACTVVSKRSASSVGLLFWGQGGTARCLVSVKLYKTVSPAVLYGQQ